jgi:8-oxo-dGTP diphosphatase
LEAAGKVRIMDVNCNVLDVGATIHETLFRECKEELGREIKINYLSGVYFHANHHSHAFVFRCEFSDNLPIELSSEHSAYQYLSASELTYSHIQKIADCLNYNSITVSNKF